jgi:hypothetical protein
MFYKYLFVASERMIILCDRNLSETGLSCGAEIIWKVAACKLAAAAAAAAAIHFL